MKLLNTYCLENPKPHQILLTSFTYISRRYLINSIRRKGSLLCTGKLAHTVASWLQVNGYKVRTK